MKSIKIYTSLLVALFCVVFMLHTARAVVFRENTTAKIKQRIESGIENGALEIRERKIFALDGVREFYTEREYLPAWIEGHVPSVRSIAYLDQLVSSAGEGMYLDNYHYFELRQLMKKFDREIRAGRPPDPGLLADIDILLTDSFMLFGAHASAGRVDPHTYEPEWTASHAPVDMVEILDEVLDGGNIREATKSLFPSNESYSGLKKALLRYRNIAIRGGWKMLPEIEEPLEPGGESDIVPALRERLAAEGYFGPTENDGGNLYDENLAGAVSIFQSKHGLEPDGILDSESIEELNISAEARIDQIEMNMERWRRGPRDFGDTYIYVNVADFSLRAFSSERETLEMKVIVGRPYRRTPLLSSKISYIVFNPCWNVPHNIAVRDELPKIKNDPTFLADHNMKLYSDWNSGSKEIDPGTIDWTSVEADNFDYRIMQEPGAGNALGHVKFMFPNEYSVYLHDTPARSLFSKRERTFSSGCVRLEKPLELARWLLEGVPGWKDGTVDRVLATNRQRTVYLPEPVDVHLVYFTAMAPDDGPVEFRRDIYGRDMRLLEAIARNFRDRGGEEFHEVAAAREY